MTTKLRREMDNAMVLRGFSPRTRECYLACVAALAQHYGQSPDGLDVAQIQAYLLHLIGERKLAYASVNQAVCSGTRSWRSRSRWRSFPSGCRKSCRASRSST